MFTFMSLHLEVEYNMLCLCSHIYWELSKEVRCAYKSIKLTHFHNVHARNVSGIKSSTPSHSVCTCDTAVDICVLDCS